NGASGFAGDGGPATAAELNYPTGVALDAAGDLFIADQDSSVVRKVDGTTRAISTVAGMAGMFDFSGDGGAATAAQLYCPAGVALDAAGDLFIADSGNCVIRKVATTGKISTVAGTGGACGFAGDGGAGTAAQLNSPMDVALDSTGNLFIADTYNFRIRQVGATSHKMSTLAGNGGPAAAAELYLPAGVALDVAGNLFIADQDNFVIRRVDAMTHQISTVAGTPGISGFAGDGGSATAAELSTTTGVALDGAGNLFIADSGNCVIRKVAAATGAISTVAGIGGACGFAGDGGAATAAELNLPLDVVLDG